MSDTKKIKMLGIACDGKNSYFPDAVYDIDSKTAKAWVKAGAAVYVEPEAEEVDPDAEAEKKAAEEAAAKKKEEEAAAKKAEAQKTENGAKG